MYSAKDLAVIIPTKDRPVQVKRHLQSLVDQNCELGSVIVVATGQDIKDIVLGFEDSLPVEYYRSKPGQIHQRNLGISKLNDLTKLVATMDDDIIYKKNAINNIIDFWNTIDGNTAGVGFNLITIKNKSNAAILNKFKKWFNIRPGVVMLSGSKIPFYNLSKNIRTQFLGGGYTIWRKEILNEFKQSEINTIWAQGEDLRFSYPISKKYNLYICFNAQVKEINSEIAYDASKIFIAKKKALAKIYFTSCHNELSTGLAFGLLLFKIILNILSIKKFQDAVGQIFAVFIIIYSKIIKKDLIQYLSD